MSVTGLSGRTTSERPKKLALKLRGSAAAPLMAARTDGGKKTGALDGRPAAPGGRGGREALPPAPAGPRARTSAAAAATAAAPCGTRLTV